MISRPCYCGRSEVKQALDLENTARADRQVDRAMESAADDIEGRLHRRFYPEDATRYKDWPNYQSAVPWRIWLDADELALPATQVTSGGAVLPLGNLFFEPVDRAPPYTYIEINRSSSSAFSAGTTPQRNVAITGTFGYSAVTVPAGALAAAVTDTTGTSVTVTDSSRADAGHILLADAERMLVTDRAMVSTGQTQQGAGAGAASMADVALSVTDGTKYFPGETLLLDSERMLVVDVAGNVVTVKRAFDGSVLATHSGATIYAQRLLTVTRGALGTAAATHLNAAPVVRFQPPALIRDLAIAEALNQVLQETSGYSRTVGEGDTLMAARGTALAIKWDKAARRHGRNARTRTV